jgi:hypothetical protein
MKHFQGLHHHFYSYCYYCCNRHLNNIVLGHKQTNENEFLILSVR